MTDIPILRRAAAGIPALSRHPRAVRAAVALALLLFARWWCATGIAWSEGFHPDEFPVARWIDQVRDEGYITERPYPGGWFELARIGMWAEKRAAMHERAVEEHRSQDGRVHALSEHAFVKSAPPRYKKPIHGVQWGRDFNVALYAITALLLFAAALESGLGTPAAAVSAAFFLFSPFPLEHAHYCETDMGVLATMALAFLLSARAVRLGSIAWAVAASFAAGFCVSCKYTVLPILVCPPVIAAAIAFRKFGKAPLRRPVRAAAVATVATIAVAAAVGGFLAGTPVLFHDLPMALRELRENPHFEADSILKFGSLFRETAKFGPFVIAWLALSTSLSVRRAWRRPFAVPLLFLALFALYVAFVLPWFRNQELLPLFATLCLVAGLPVEAALRRSTRRRVAGPALAAAALAAVALASEFFDAHRMLSCFSGRDTRAECQNFLAASLPRGAGLALDGYVMQVARGVPDAVCAPAAVVAERWPESLADEDMTAVFTADPSLGRYLVRNASLLNRRGLPHRERFSGRDKPAAVAAKAKFSRDVPLLRAWKLPSGRVRPLFAQPDVELRAFPGDGAGKGLRDVSIPFARPALVLPNRTPLYDASGSPWFGPRQALPFADGHATLRMACDGAPRWLVSMPYGPSPADTPARIERGGSFAPKVSRLQAGQAVAAKWRPPRALSALATSVFPEVCLRLRGSGMKNACLSFVASDPAEAAMELRRAGNAGAALSLLRDGGGPTGETARVEAFLAAKAEGSRSEPEWEESARAALAAFDALNAAAAGNGGAFPGEATVCGVPIRALRDFSRIRLRSVPVGPGANIRATAPAGHYSMRCIVRPEAAALVADIRLFEGQTAPFAREETPDGRIVLLAEIEKTGDGPALFSSAAPDPFAGAVAVLDELELSWDPLEQISRSAADIRAALRR